MLLCATPASFQHPYVQAGIFHIKFKKPGGCRKYNQKQKFEIGKKKTLKIGRSGGAHARPSARSMAIELARGALVTAALRSPRLSIHARNAPRPSTGSSTDSGRAHDPTSVHTRCPVAQQLPSLSRLGHTELAPSHGSSTESGRAHGGHCVGGRPPLWHAGLHRSTRDACTPAKRPSPRTHGGGGYLLRRTTPCWDAGHATGALAAPGGVCRQQRGSRAEQGLLHAQQAPRAMQGGQSQG